MSHQRPQLGPGDILVVIHDFDARGDDELNLRKADRIQLMELDDGFGDGWYLGRHLRLGTTGLFPGGISSPSPLRCQLSTPALTAHQSTLQNFLQTSPRLEPPIQRLRHFHMPLVQTKVLRMIDLYPLHP